MYLYFLIPIILIALWVVWSLFRVNNLESPQYIVLNLHRGYQIRKYQPYIVAQTTVSKNGSSSRRAFRELAGYIFGGNTSQKNISMTVPVTTEPSSQNIAMTAPVATEERGEYLTMSFMMPSGFTLENLPVPHSKKISFSEVDESTFAVLSFSGWATDKRRIQKTKELQQLLIQDGIDFESSAQLLQYDQPLVFPLFRTNEIKIKIVS